MSWVSDLASLLGIPAGAATLAVAIYAACAAAEKVARPDALKDIGRVLKETSWERDFQPSTIIRRVFLLTFGERHLSWKCVRRSVEASAFVITATLVVLLAHGYHMAHGTFPLGLIVGLIGIGVAFLICSLVPDYLALAKTRLFLGLSRSGMLAILTLVMVDIFLSALISIATMLLVGDILIIGFMGIEYWRVNAASLFVGMFASLWNGEPLSMYVVMLCSTLFTSIWLALILLSAVALKVITPLHHFTTWFFDVEKSPIQALGIVSGALIMIGALVWTVIRATI